MICKGKLGTETLCPDNVNNVQLSLTPPTGAQQDREVAVAQPSPRVAAPHCRRVITQKT